MINIGTLNCRGITSYCEKKNLVKDVATHGLLICAIQETHIADSDITSIFNKSDNSIYNVHTISCEIEGMGLDL